MSAIFTSIHIYMHTAAVTVCWSTQTSNQGMRRSDCRRTLQNLRSCVVRFLLVADKISDLICVVSTRNHQYWHLPQPSIQRHLLFSFININEMGWALSSVNRRRQAGLILCCVAACCLRGNGLIKHPVYDHPHVGLPTCNGLLPLYVGCRPV